MTSPRRYPSATSHNPDNERVKRRYFEYAEEAKRQNEVTVDAIAKALARFEAHTGFRDFRSFRHEQAFAFKKHLEKEIARRSGKTLSKATLHSTLSHLRRFFFWLPDQPGYRKLRYSDADYFNLSDGSPRPAARSEGPPSSRSAK